MNMPNVLRSLVITACFLLVWTTACQPRFADDSPADASSPEPTMLPAPSPTPERSAYTFSRGLKTEYPSGWVYEVSDAPGSSESVWFRSPDPSVAAIGVEVAPRPLAERSVADPYTWMPNEGGYEIHWSEPISTGELGGLMIVWGVQQDGVWDGPVFLMAIFYDTARELDIRVTTEINPRQLEMADTMGLAEVVQTQFEVFNLIIDHLDFG